ANWDSTRFYLNQIVEHHANSPVVNQAKLLYTEIELPESIQKIVIDSLQSINTDSIDIDPSVADSVLQVLDTEISIEPVKEPSDSTQVDSIKVQSFDPRN